MREPLLLPLIAVTAGVVFGQALGVEVREVLWPTVVLGGMACIPVSRWLRATALGCALVFLGTFSVAWHRPAGMPRLNVDPREAVVMQGCVVEPTVFANDQDRFVLELAPGAKAQVDVPRYAEEETPPRLQYGQRLEVEARFRSPRSYNNPGTFDYAAYLARRNIFWTALVPSGGEVRILPGECGFRAMAWIYALRTEALDRIDALFPDDKYSRAMLEAVLIGESSSLERVWTEDFRRSGTYHALVISGIHVSVLAATLLFLLRWLPISKNKALALTAVLAWVYALVSGFSVPVVRAAAGFSLYLVAQVTFRRARPLNLLAAIALAYLAWDPLQLFEASFQLSFLSIAAIAAFAMPILERTVGPLAQAARDINTIDIDPHLEPRCAQWRVELRLVAETVELWTHVPARVAAPMMAGAMRAVFYGVELIVLSLAVQIGLSLPMAEYFHRVSFTGLSANLFIVPLMNMVVPVGFLAIFTRWHWAAELARTLLGWSAAIARWHAAREPAWRVPDPPAWLALALVAMVAIGAILLRRERMRWPAVSAVAVLLGLLVASPWAAATSPGELELTAIDVGQGDSLLLVFPQGATMLIDGGGRLVYGKTKRQTNFDTGEDVVSPYLWSRGIRHIDVIAATHAHQDHIGGLRALVENFHPGELWTGANPPVELEKYASSFGVKVRELREGPAAVFSGAQLEVLAPGVGYAAAKLGNNDSLVLRVSYGSRTFLLMGDLERPEEQRLLDEGRLLRSDVLKVGHHGSRTSTSQEFLDAVAPSVAMISAGYLNSFNHPHPEVLDRLQSRHTTILRTDQAGLATVRTDGQHLEYSIASWREPSRLLELPEHLLH